MFPMLLVWTRCWPNSWVADATAMMGCHFVFYTGTAVLLTYYTAYWYTCASENCQQVSWCILSWTTLHKRLLLWDNLPNVMFSSWLLDQLEPGAFISLSCCQTSLDLIRQPINLIPAIMLYGSGYETAAVLLSGFIISWWQNQTIQLLLHD